MKTRTIILSVCKIIAAVIMLQTLFFKFTAHPQSVALFTAIGLEPFGRIGVGIAELIASISLFIPKITQYGAFLTIGLMVGALFFHLTVLGFEGENLQLTIMACITLISALYIAYKTTQTHTEEK